MKFARTLALVDLLKKQAEILRRDGMAAEAMALIKETRQLKLLAELHTPPPGRVRIRAMRRRSLPAI